jgi:H+/gluconate symporter-like permease
MLDIFFIVLSLALLMYLAFRGITLLILAPAMAILAAALTGGLPLLAGYTQIFMVATGRFIIDFFPLFLLGAIFGKLMDDSGAARAIAKGVIAALGPSRAILAVVLCCAVLTYGGVSLFVVAFAIFPVAAALFRGADIPKRLIPAALALGAFTFTMSALPGTPAIQNAIPMPFFGTTAFAAPGLGVITGAIMLVLGMAWLLFRAGQARAAGEGYGLHEDSLPTSNVELRQRAAQSENFDVSEMSPQRDEGAALPPFWLALAPVAVVIAVNFAFVQVVLPAVDTSFLAEARFGPTTIEAVRGVWSIIVALLVAIGFLVATNWGRLRDLRASLDGGADASVLPIFNTASLVGFGAVIAALPAFAVLSEAVLSIGGNNPLISLAAAVNLLSAMTGSASGGMSIALDALGPTYVELARQTGTSLEAMHRVTAVASGALDALPHNGAVITVLAICKLGHRQAYGDMFMVAVAVPMVALIALIVLATLFGAF